MGGSASIIDDLKVKGDDVYRQGMFGEAIYYYSLALSASDGESRPRNLAVLFSNRSAAFIGNKQPEAALQDALRAITADPTWSRCYYRAAVSCYLMNEIDTALEYLKTAESLTANDESIRKLKNEIFSKP